MSKLICFFVITLLSAAYADQEFDDFVQQLAEALNPHGSNGNQNSLLLSLTNGEHLLGTTLLGNSSHKLQVNVTFSGTVQVSAQRDNQKVQIKSQWSGGAGLQENEEGTSELKFLEDINNRITEAQNNLDDDTTSVLIAHAADTGVEARDNKRSAKAKVVGGFVVGATTTVTKK